MRPDQIEIEGFGTFRARTVVDFTGVDLFGFTGSTGSGKSTLIDAIVFALYGAVPRYEHKNLVAPAVSQGATEAKVQLRFTVGADTYTAIRVVRSKDGKASTREARLERGDETLAGNKAEMNVAVEGLLGLDFEQFTTCVVLPQGQFATLLHANAAERQELLVRLLDLGMYRQLGKRARQIGAQADHECEILDRQLADSADVTDDAIAAAEQRATSLAGLAARVDEVLPQVEQLTGLINQCTERRQADQRRFDELAAIGAPRDVDALASGLAEAADRVAAVRGEVVEAATLVAAAEEVRSDLGDEAPRRELQRVHQRMAELVGKLDKGQIVVAEARNHALNIETAHEAARIELERQVESLDALKRLHAIVDAAGHVHVGDACPLCGNTVEQIIEVDRRALGAGEQSVAAAKAAHAQAQDALGAAREQVAKVEAHFENLSAEFAQIEAAIDGAPSTAEIDTLLAAIVEAERALTVARAGERAAASRLDAALLAEKQAEQAESTARRDFGAARDLVAALAGDDRPPQPDGQHLGDDWRVLLAWVETQRVRVRAAVDESDRQLVEASDKRAALTADLVSEFAAAGEAPPEPDEARSTARMLAVGAAERLASLRTRAEQRAARLADREASGEVAHVHRMLGQLLSATGFEQWLLAEAVESLVDGASNWLGELSSGGYALGLNEKGDEFVVIDRHDADQRRIARTLSGGETFLASLALALALAERISDLAAEGAPKLESIFLDEGFGTLDPQTLDVVASAIEELGATGRMVGVVSHVAELADRLPTVFHVTKGSDTSTVERIDR